ncbi:MAG: hypothetical protein IJP90_19285 [Treponema sp.]|nr:hypothetical protein [Treponema sp.]
MKKKTTIIIAVFVVGVIAIGSVYARKKGNIHYKAKCDGCSCSEFVSDADSHYKCYNCGHADYRHRR